MGPFNLLFLGTLLCLTQGCETERAAPEPNSIPPAPLGLGSTPDPPRLTSAAASEPLPPAPQHVQNDPVVFADGRLSPGYDLGVTSSSGRTDWVHDRNGALCMAYPAGQSWGAVFITVGPLRQPPRPGQNMTRYQGLTVQLRGERGGEAVLVGLKDNTDPDDGSETKVLVQDVSADWESFEIPLRSFVSTDLARVYVLTEFVFDGGPQTVCFRDIRFN